MPFKCNGDMHTLLARRTASFSPCSSRSSDDISRNDGGGAQSSSRTCLQLFNLKCANKEAAAPYLLAHLPAIPAGSD